MEKSNEQILIENGYTFIKENPDTGWVQIAVTEDATVSAFWVPAQIVGHLMNLYYLQENVALSQNIREKDRNKISALKLKIDSQRKSIEYYKGERNTYKRIADKQAKDLENLLDEFKNYKQTNTTHISNLEDGNEILKMELEIVNDELKYSQRATLKSIAANVVLILILLIMIAL